MLLQSTFAFSNPNNVFIKNWQKKGFLVLGVPVKMGKLDPILFLNAHTKLSLPLIYEPLISIGSQQELQPILAQSWLITDDNHSIIITIKSRHYFSDNTEVTSRDIANTMERICSEKSNVFEEIKGLDGCVEHVKNKNIKLGLSIIDKYRIKFNINCSPTNFLSQLASPALVITKLFKDGLIGSGSYILQEANNEYIILKKNPYASIDNKTFNQGVVLFYADGNNLRNILLEDKPDGALMYKMQDVWNIQDKNYNLERIKPNITEVMVLNNQRFPFNNVLFRKYFAAAIYNNFNQQCIPGAHKAYGLIPTGTGGALDGNAPQFLYEMPMDEVFKKIPELKIKKTTITIQQLEDSKNSCESNQIIDIAKKFNIDLKFEYHKNYATLIPLYLNHQLDGFVELYVFKNREAYSVLQFFTKLGTNHANVKDLKIDSMLQDAISESSSHRRFQAYQNIAKYIQNQGIIIPLFYMDHANIVSKCISGIPPDFLFNPFLHISQLQRTNDCKI